MVRYNNLTGDLRPYWKAGIMGNDTIVGVGLFVVITPWRTLQLCSTVGLGGIYSQFMMITNEVRN